MERRGHLIVPGGVSDEEGGSGGGKAGFREFACRTRTARQEEGQEEDDALAACDYEAPAPAADPSASPA